MSSARPQAGFALVRMRITLDDGTRMTLTATVPEEDALAFWREFDAPQGIKDGDVQARPCAEPPR